MFRLSVKKTVCASSNESATECLEVARGPMAGTMVLAKLAGVVQLVLNVWDNACAKGERLCATTASNTVKSGFIEI